MNFPARLETSLLSTQRPRETGTPSPTQKRPRVQNHDYTASDADVIRNEVPRSNSNDVSFSFFAADSAVANRESDLIAVPDHHAPGAASGLQQAQPNHAQPPAQPNVEPLIPGFQYVPAHSQPTQEPLLSGFDAPNADIEVITLDDEDDLPQPQAAEKQQYPLTSVRRPPVLIPESEVIDLDDDEALANLQPLPKEQTRLHISRGGGLFRAQPSGQLEIVDSDDENELTRTHRIVSREDGLHTLPSIAQLAQQLAAPAAEQPAPALDQGLLYHSEHEMITPIQRTKGAIVQEPEPNTALQPQAPISPTIAASTMIVPEPYRAQSQHAACVASTTPISTPELTRWPHPSMNTHAPSAMLPAEIQPRLAPRPSEMFLRGFAPTAMGEPSRFQASSVIVPSSQANVLPHGTAMSSTALPLSGTTWLHAGSPHALFHAQQRLGLAQARTLANPSNAPFQAATVNPSETGIPATQVTHNSTMPTSNTHASSSAFPETAENSISPEGLRALVKQNSLTADATEEADTPTELNVSLMQHQRRALHWMSKREVPVEVDEDISAVDEQCLGGILADDQGLGKTLTMIALMLQNRPGTAAAVATQKRKRRNQSSDESVDLETESSDEDDDESETISDDDDVVPQDRSEDPPWRTLVVCPLSVIHQWREEIVSRIREEYIPRVCIYHGPKRERRQRVLENCDVVITTYATLVAEYPKVLKDHPEFKARRKAKLPLPRRTEGPLCRVAWHRVVLDESQHVKNRGTDSWSAVMSLKSEKRWCLTGTPIQNSVDDIYSLFCFIRYQFVPNYETWNMRWKRKLEHSRADVRERAFRRFQTIVGVVLLRRTKNDTIKGAPLITLPKRSTEIEEPEFCDKEEEVVYKAVQEKSVVTFNKFLVAGTLANNYSSVLLVLLRLRQACSHPFLIEYAGMHNRGRSAVKAASEIMSNRYSTMYSAEELEEAMELVAGGHSLLSMIDEAARKRLQDALMPPAKGMVATTRYSCQYCQRDSPWYQGSFLACGDLFCMDCCHLLRKERRCLRCLSSIEDPNLTEVFINAEDLRKEVHAGIILAEERENELPMTASEFKALVQLEVIKRRTGSGSDTVTPESTDGEVDDADDDDAALDRLEQTILEKKTKELCDGNATASCKQTEEKKKRLLSALSQHSTKIRKILDKLSEIRKRDSSEKTLIFSQWTSMLDIIEFHVQLDGHEVCRLDGSMTLSARQKQIEAFKSSPTKTVFLISLHAGGTGLNLTAASNVIIADVWWNPAVEEQAIDRVHRIGQTKDVTVTRFKIKGTVEERIYAICAKKREASDGTLGVTGAQSLGRQKLSMQDLMNIFGGAAQDVAQTAQRGSAAAEAARNILNYQQHGTL